MIDAAIDADGPRVREIAARAGVFNPAEVECVGLLWQEYLTAGPETCGYNFIVDRDGEQVLGFACYGPRDLTSGVFDLYWIAVDPECRRAGAGARLLAAGEQAARAAGGRMVVAETSCTAPYAATREFYSRKGYSIEARIRDFYRVGDDLAIFIKRF